MLDFIKRKSRYGEFGSAPLLRLSPELLVAPRGCRREPETPRGEPWGISLEAGVGGRSEPEAPRDKPWGIFERSPRASSTGTASIGRTSNWSAVTCHRALLKDRDAVAARDQRVPRLCSNGTTERSRVPCQTGASRSWFNPRARGCHRTPVRRVSPSTCRCGIHRSRTCHRRREVPPPERNCPKTPLDIPVDDGAIGSLPD